MSSATALPTYFLSHGGGPWPWMIGGDSGFGRGTFDRLDASLKAMRRELGDAPRAVLMVSGHWEEPVFTLSSAARPPMLYDYYGFPREMYAIRYDAPGDPVLAGQAGELLNEGGMTARLDPARGFDHGTFSLMQAIWPEAQMPVVQLSIRNDFDPQAHLAAGRLLAPLRKEGVLIVGSGLSYHNLRLMGPAGHAPSLAFDTWLHRALTGTKGEDRAELLRHWDRAPAARIAQPREDHFLPLLVAAGAAEDEDAFGTYREDGFMGIVASSFRFGAVPEREAA